VKKRLGIPVLEELAWFPGPVSGQESGSKG
jgi:hypothetical protein